MLSMITIAGKSRRHKSLCKFNTGISPNRSVNLISVEIKNFKGGYRYGESFIKDKISDALQDTHEGIYTLQHCKTTQKA